MQIHITIDEATDDATLVKLQRMLGAYRGTANFSGSPMAPEEIAQDDALPSGPVVAEAPAFGRQPLPPEATTAPLPPSGAPSPAGAGVSTSAPEAAPASSPTPPIAATAVPPPPTAAATHTPAGSAELDAKGLPWDERIHSGSRGKNQDGTWRYRRWKEGKQDALIAAVEAELRGGTPMPPPATAAAVPPPPSPLDNLKPEVPLPPAAPALTFGQVAKRVGAKITLQELTPAQLTTKLAELGFPGGLHTLNTRPDMWETVLEALGA